MTETIAILGTGVIGASWAALFAAKGFDVRAYDPNPDGPAFLHRYVEEAWPTLVALGATVIEEVIQPTFVHSVKEAVESADFIQESVPERLPIKEELYREVEPHLKPGAVLATSASGLMLSELQACWDDPSPLVLGHPFNPPHLIPLVEVMGNERTRAGAVEQAEAVYAKAGKVTIRVQKEVPGHVSNRLQAALWREAIHLVQEGVVSVGDVDTAVWAGPGVRWAAAGPNEIWHMAAGPGGLEDYCARYGDSFNRWWRDLGQPQMTPEVAKMLANGVAQATNDAPLDALQSDRDARLLGILQATLSVPRR